MLRAPDPVSALPSTGSSFWTGFFATFRLEVAEAFRARWFAIYAAVFFGLVGLLLVFAQASGIAPFIYTLF